MIRFETAWLARAPVDTAPDGSEVRALLAFTAGGLAHFELISSRTSLAVVHHTVDEIWYVVSGTGEIWRKQGKREETVPLAPGVCITIPRGTHFQFRANRTLSIIGATLPRWPGAHEAERIAGPWSPTIDAGG